MLSGRASEPVIGRSFVRLPSCLENIVFSFFRVCLCHWRKIPLSFIQPMSHFFHIYFYHVMRCFPQLTAYIGIADMCANRLVNLEVRLQVTLILLVNQFQFNSIYLLRPLCATHKPTKLELFPSYNKIYIVPCAVLTNSKRLCPVGPPKPWQLFYTGTRFSKPSKDLSKRFQVREVLFIFPLYQVVLLFRAN